MTKEIREFVEMMEQQQTVLVLANAITSSKEFEALKSLLDKPISKAEINEDVIRAATIAHYKAGWTYSLVYNDFELPKWEELPSHEHDGFYSLMKTALEAIFAMQLTKEKLSEKEEADYKIIALESELHDLVDSILNCKDLDRLKKTTLKNFPDREIKEDGGWIEWKGGECPLEPGQSAQVKLKNGSEHTYQYHLGDYFWDIRNDVDTGNNIIAYRIIKEEKTCTGCHVNLYQNVCECPMSEEKKEAEYDAAYTHFNNTNYCQCDNPLLYARQSEIPHGASYACCSKCQRLANPIKKEPKKQTLWDYAKGRMPDFVHADRVHERCVLSLVSEYLEQNK